MAISPPQGVTPKVNTQKETNIAIYVFHSAFMGESVVHIERLHVFDFHHQQYTL